MKKILLLGLCMFILLVGIVNAEDIKFSDNCTSTADWSSGGAGYPGNLVVYDTTWFMPTLFTNNSYRGMQYDLTAGHPYSSFSTSSNFSIYFRATATENEVDYWNVVATTNSNSQTDKIWIRFSAEAEDDILIYFNNQIYYHDKTIPSDGIRDVRVGYNDSGNNTFDVWINGTKQTSGTNNTAVVVSTYVVNYIGLATHQEPFTLKAFDWVTFVDHTTTTPPSSTTLNITYPNEDEHISYTKVQVNVTGNYTLGNCTINNTIWDIAWYNASSFSFENTSATPDDFYSVRINCTDAAGLNPNNATRAFYIDRTSPTITVNPNNFFNTSNNTILSKDNSFYSFFNISFADELELYSYNINVTNNLTGASRELYFNNSNSSIGMNLTYIATVNLSDGSEGYRVVDIIAWDAHTATKISPIDVKKGLNYILFDGKIRIKADSAIMADSTKYDDRYNFEFKYLPIGTPKTKVFYIESDGKLDYLKNSKYKAHFVDFKNKKWVDFEGLSSSPVVTKVNDYKYKVEFSNEGTSVIFNSIGELNSKQATYQFYLENGEPEINWFIPTQIINTITSSNDFLLNLNVTDSYRNYTTFNLYNLTYGLINSTNISNRGNGRYLYNLTFTGLTDQLYYVNATHYDQYNNSASSTTLTLSNVYLDNCSVASMQTINFTARNASDNAYVTVTSQFFFTYNSTNYAGNNIYLNYSTKETSSEFTFCLFPNQTILNSDMWIDYSYNSIAYNYFADDIGLTNITQLITLYTQDDTSSVQFRVSDIISGNSVAGAYIKILRFNVGSGTYNTVEVLKTDSEGYALGNIILQTEWYKFVIVYDGATKLITEPEKFPAGTTTRKFKISLITTWYDNYNIMLGIEYNLTFNNVTNNFKFTFTDPTSAMHIGCLKVEKINVTGTTLLTDNCTESTAATLLYSIGAAGANMTGHYIATGYIQFDDPYILDILEKAWAGSWKLFALKEKDGRPLGLFLSFMIVITLTFIAIWHPLSAIIMSVVGVLITSLLGFYEISYVALMSLVIIAFIFIIKLGKR